MRQQTIKRQVSLSGIGLHSGEPSTLTFKPAGENTGIVFIKAGEKIEASLENVSLTLRGTSLKGIQTVEHVLAASYGLGVDNLEIELEGAEPPAEDGSSLSYVNLLKEAKIIEQRAVRRFMEIENPIYIKDKDRAIVALPSETLELSFVLDYPESFVGMQRASFVEGKDDFEKELAPARTFGFLKEVEELWAKGLALGGTLDNAIVIKEHEYSCPLRFKNELARHKILDLMGDLALLGKRVKGKIMALKSGHELNLRLARAIAGGGLNFS